MVAPAPHRQTRGTLVQKRVDWRPTPEKLYEAISVPPGFRKELSLGRVRIGHPDGRIDHALLDLADRLGDDLPDKLGLDIYAGRIVVGGVPRLVHYVTVFKLDLQLRPVVIQNGWMLIPGSAVVIPRLREHVRPDLMVVRADAPTFDEVYCGKGRALGRRGHLAGECRQRP